MRNTSSKTSAWMSLKAILTLIALSGAVALFSSCDEEENPAPPSVTLSQESFSGPAGTDAGMTVTIVAPAGAKTLSILKNGVAYATQEFTGEKDAEYEFDYIIENLSIGTSTNFTFELTDKKDQVSNTGTYTVTVAAKTVINKSGIISASETWTADNIYRIQGYLRVGDDATRLNGATTITGVTLTIEPGTVIIGERSSKGTLIIHRGNKIMAEGTESNPIVFTSEREQGSRAAGDWGGVVICGKAANNQGTDVQLEGGYGAYHGGSTDNDNSGILKYVRIEYAGVPINPNQEVNSLTLGSPGSGTVISYVMCSHGLDDAFEWFGGTANADHLIAYKGFDDDFDVDFGFRGTVQFAIAIREPNSADQSGSNGFEVDNDGNSSANTPFTSATFSNVSIIGPKATNETQISAQFQNAAHLRRNNKIKIYNSFFTGYPNGIFIDGAGTVTNAGSGDLVLKKNVLAGVNNWGGNGFGSTTNTDESTNVTGLPFGTNANHATLPRGLWMATTANIGGNTPLVWFKANNEVYSKWTDVGVSSNIFAANFGANSPTLLPTAGSALLTGAEFTNLTGLQSVTFRGAFGTTDWTSGWANWNPQTATYQ